MFYFSLHLPVIGKTPIPPLPVQQQAKAMSCLGYQGLWEKHCLSNTKQEIRGNPWESSATSLPHLFFSTDQSSFLIISWSGEPKRHLGRRRRGKQLECLWTGYNGNWDFSSYRLLNILAVASIWKHYIYLYVYLYYICNKIYISIYLCSTFLKCPKFKSNWMRLRMR